jgi:hypothetical protein
MNDFNNTVNSILDPILGNDYIRSSLYLFFIVYGSLAAPSLPPRLAPLFSNSIFRMTIMALVVWIWNKDPAVAIMVAVSYFITMHYLMQNGLAEILRTGIVSPEVAIMISGGGGPSLKPSSVIQAEAQLMQASVNNSKSPGFISAPEALLSSGPVSTTAVAGIPSVPSETKATTASMMATYPEGGMPQAFTPDDIHDLAIAPK